MDDALLDDALHDAHHADLTKLGLGNALTNVAQMPGKSAVIASHADAPTRVTADMRAPAPPAKTTPGQLGPDTQGPGQKE